MSEMQSPSSIESQARKLRSLVMMFSICPKASTDESAAEIYLRLCENVPAEFFEAAVFEIMGSWQWPHPPMPAEIIDTAKKLAKKQRKAANREIENHREVQRQLATEASSLSPEEVQERFKALRDSLSGTKRKGESSIADVLPKGAA